MHNYHIQSQIFVTNIFRRINAMIKNGCAIDTCVVGNQHLRGLLHRLWATLPADAVSATILLLYISTSIVIISTNIISMIKISSATAQSTPFSFQCHAIYNFGNPFKSLELFGNSKRTWICTGAWLELTLQRCSLSKIGNRLSWLGWQAAHIALVSKLSE